jgi:hypothetical protein
MIAGLRQVWHGKWLVAVLALMALVLVGAFVGCGDERSVSSEAMQRRGATAAGGGAFQGGTGGGGGMRMARAARSAATAPASESGFEQAPASSWPKSPMVIRNASLDLRVDDVTRVQREIGRLARDAGGYVAGATLRSEDKPETATITVRVPNEGLDDMLDRIAALGRLLSKKLTAQEVTEEYVDLSSRKRNLEREEGRLLELLDRAGKVHELLEVEQEVSRVRGEIEMTAGRMRYLENRVALSTVQVQLSGPEPPVSRGGPVWAATDVARQAFRSLRHTGRGLATVGIWLGIFAPLWLPVGLVLLWWARRASPPRRPAEAPAVGPIGPGRA